MGELTGFDEIGQWSEIKLEILRKYAEAYSVILNKQPHLQYAYIDAFAGPGMHQRKGTRELVPGSPLNALYVAHRFHRYVFIDLDGSKVKTLRDLTRDRQDVEIYQGDCNRVLLERVFPTVQYQDYWRALCLLDPYGLHLEWRAMAAAAATRATDLFVNFPIMDMNRNALWRRPDGVDPRQIDRMDAFWGDDSWRSVVYRPARQPSLFGDADPDKEPNEAVVHGFLERLQNVAGFPHVARPAAMKNSTGAVIYYLLFASHNATAVKIANSIMKAYDG